MSHGNKQRFLIVGLGNRGRDSFARALLGFEKRGLPEFTERAEIVGLVDHNRERARVANDVLGTDIPVYDDLAEATGRHDADWAIITTPDFTHADIAESALDRGLHVIIDKPLATSVWECDRIIEAGKRNGREVIVGHNLRYNEHMLAMAKLVRGGAIGEVRQVESAEILDLSHGGSYFHRWHSEFDKSAGLMNHKCCHQLDIINWVIEDEPIAVSGVGGRRYYVPRPDSNAGMRCSDCAITADCPHYCRLDVAYPSGRPQDESRLRRMYVDVEHVDGYIRDACVFSDRNTVNDHEVLNIEYRSGILCSFSLMTFAPREYAYFYFTGTEGRLEYSVVFEPDAAMEKDIGGAEMGMFANEGKPQIRLLRKNGTVEIIDVRALHAGYGHGGADVKLAADILGVPIEGVDPIQLATSEQARNAVAIADMAARSIAAGGRPVSIEETGKDFPPFPPGAKRLSTKPSRS